MDPRVGVTMRLPLGAALVSVLLSGCSSDSGGCTEIGAIEGMSLGISQELFVRSGSVLIEVCDEQGCESVTESLGRLKTPVGRGATGYWTDLGRVYGPGTVAVNVELRDESEQLVATRHQEVKVRRIWPNGKACDGDGYLGGSLSLEPSDAV